MEDVCAVRCQFVKTDEFNGRPQLVFRLPGKYQYSEFSVAYDPSMYPAPSDNRTRWYAFAPENFKYRCQPRFYLGELNENYFKEA